MTKIVSRTRFIVTFIHILPLLLIDFRENEYDDSHIFSVFPLDRLVDIN
jgi:hypothetical protein